MAETVLFYFLCFVCCGQLFASVLLYNNGENKSLRLDQVVVLARHNVRTPLSKLQKMTPKKWPVWNETASHLAKKGALLEEKNAEFIKKLIVDEGLLSNECPNENEVLIYANIPQRTLQTAKIFAERAFRNCNVTVHYETGDFEMDPVFNPTIQSNSNILRYMMMSEMQEKLDKSDLREQYLELNRILDLNNSEMCTKDSVCDLTDDTHRIIVKAGTEPTVEGPLDFSNAIVDSLLMQYYNGDPLDSIAWGEIDHEKLKSLAEILAQHQNVRFNSSNIAKDVAKPLLKYMADIFLIGKPKFTLLVGHDSNINVVMRALNFKSYELKDQFEKTPVGSKLFFLKYFDKVREKYLLKIAYYYETIEQLRYGNTSLENPPYHTVLEMDECKLDNNGYCPWEDFENVMKTWQ